MTFKQAVEALDNQGEYGAKRPSMRGYAFKETTDAAEGEAPAEAKLKIVARDGTATTIGECGAMTMTGEMFDAFVFADDWELSKRAELEKARAGEGTM